VKEVCFNPRGFHGASANNDNPWPAVTFACTTAGFFGLIAGIFLALWYVALGGIGAMGALSGGKGAAGPGAAVFGIMATMGIFMAILIPIFYVCYAFMMTWINGAIFHICLAILKGTSRSFSSTIRVVGYSHAALVFGIIPGIGGLAALVVMLISWVVGFDETHKSGIGKALLAVFMPMILLCVCACGCGALSGALTSATHHR
jgi:hypothetical protein